jgi:hypothetical protein
MVHHTSGDAGDGRIKTLSENSHLVGHAVAVSVAHLINAFGGGREIFPVDGAIAVVILERTTRSANFARGEDVLVKSEFGVDAVQGDIVGDPVTVFADVEVADAEAEDDEDPAAPLKLAIVGRPNAGKSTLVNRMLGEDRMITGPEAGITRDSIAIDWEWQGRPVRLIDTAGMRKRAKVQERLESIRTEADSSHLEANLRYLTRATPADLPEIIAKVGHATTTPGTTVAWHSG